MELVIQNRVFEVKKSPIPATKLPVAITASFSEDPKPILGEQPMLLHLYGAHPPTHSFSPALHCCQAFVEPGTFTFSGLSEFPVGGRVGGQFHPVGAVTPPGH